MTEKLPFPGTIKIHLPYKSKACPDGWVEISPFKPDISRREFTIISIYFKAAFTVVHYLSTPLAERLIAEYEMLTILDQIPKTMLLHSASFFVDKLAQAHDYLRKSFPEEIRNEEDHLIQLLKTSYLYTQQHWELRELKLQSCPCAYCGIRSKVIDLSLSELNSE